MFSKEVIKILDVENKVVVFDFFVFFSRMEYALKRARFYFTDDHSEVKADWKSFKKEVDKHFDAQKNKELETAANYLVNNPPKKLHGTSNGIKFQTVDFSKELSADNLIDIIHVIRNNLFHGGKFEKEEVSDLARDSDLMKYSLVLMEELVKIDSLTKEVFYNF